MRIDKHREDQSQVNSFDSGLLESDQSDDSSQKKSTGAAISEPCRERRGHPVGLPLSAIGVLAVAFQALRQRQPW